MRCVTSKLPSYGAFGPGGVGPARWTEQSQVGDRPETHSDTILPLLEVVQRKVERTFRFPQKTLRY